MNESNQVHNASCQALAGALTPKAVFLDAGAMGGPTSEQFKYLCRHDILTYVGLEPQAGECDALKRPFPRGIFLPEAVGNLQGEVALYLTVSPACI